MMQPLPDFSTLFIDFNSYFASVEQQEHPELRGKPVIVSPANTETTCAIAASYEAKAYGIRTGTKIYEARRLCPQVIVRPARHEIYVAYHHRLLEEIARHVPITKVCSIDEAYCQLLKNERSAAKAKALAIRIKEGIYKNVGACLTSSIGIGATPLLAKIASDLQKPDGLVLLPLASLPQRLSHWRLRDIPGIGANMERRLFAARITTIEQLWQLSPRHARLIWHGVGGERFWYALHGYEVPETPTQKSVIGHSRMLASDQREAHTARLVGRALLLKAAMRLRRMGYMTGALHFCASTPERHRFEQSASFCATQDSFTLLEAYDTLWQNLTTRLPPYPRFRKLSLVLHRLTPVHMRQPDLFDIAQREPTPVKSLFRSHVSHVPHHEKREKLWHALDALQSRYGRYIITPASQRPLALPYLGGKIAFNRIPEMIDADDM